MNKAELVNQPEGLVAGVRVVIDPTLTVHDQTRTGGEVR